MKFKTLMIIKAAVCLAFGVLLLGVPNQLLGVFSEDLLEPLAEVLQRLGSRHVLVVHSEDGLDEISIAAPTEVAELKDGVIRRYRIQPEDFGFQRGTLADIQVADPTESLVMLRAVLAGQPGAARDIVTLNAGAAIYCSGRAADLGEGIALAAEAIANGESERRLGRLVALTGELTGS